MKPNICTYCGADFEDWNHWSWAIFVCIFVFIIACAYGFLKKDSRLFSNALLIAVFVGIFIMIVTILIEICMDYRL